MADQAICVGVKTDGVRCNKRAVVGHARCRTHLNTVNKNGPNQTELTELSYIHKRNLKELRDQWDPRIEAERDHERKRGLIQDFNHQYRLMQLEQRHALDLLRRIQLEQIRQTGIDPDAEANRRREEERNRRLAERRQVFDRAVARFDRAEADIVEVRDVLRRAIGIADNLRNDNNRELQRFVQDAQNIHTVRTVNMTKDMVNLILTIPVPSEYKWNGNECSKTPGDIIMTCKLTSKAAWQMVSKYCQDESIYEMGPGIYGRVLDGVWQYILSSPDKADLCRCLKQEMEDNIGMCAQGNLSRLCNILAGYLDGIGSQESTSDLLGRLMPKLMEVEDISDRLNQAYKILKDNHVPVTEWKDWVDPLMNDQDVELAVGFIRNAQDEVVGFIAVEV